MGAECLAVAAQLILMPPIENVDTIDVRVEVDVSAHVADESVESLVNRVVLSLVTQMPFSNRRRCIADVSQSLGEGELRQLQPVMSMFLKCSIDDTIHAGSLLVAPC